VYETVRCIAFALGAVALAAGAVFSGQSRDICCLDANAVERACERALHGSLP
jgi:hypothetical protein